MANINSTDIFLKKINGDDYNVAFQIFNDKINIPILSAMIGSFSISYNIHELVPMATISINDNSGDTMNSISSGKNLYVKMILEKRAEESKKIEHIFILNKIELTNVVGMNYLYELQLVSVNWIKLNNYSAYSTKGKQSNLTTIKELFSSNNINLDSSELPLQSSSLASMSFITPTNYSVLNSLDYVIKRSYNSEIYGYGIGFDFISNTYKIRSIKQQLLTAKEALSRDVYPVENILFLNSKNVRTEGAISRFTINKIKEDEYAGLTKKIEHSKPIVINTFDYTNRIWSSPKISTDELTESLPITKILKREQHLVAKDDVSIIINQDVLNYQRSLPPKSDFVEYDSLYTLFFEYKPVRIQVEGDLKRSAGDIIFVTSSKLSAKDTEIVKFTGTYLIIKIDKIYTLDRMVDNIYAIKIEVNENE